MLSNQLIKIETRGNGSCGPNALGIIFCSYLLTDQYEQKRIDLRSFARIWNLFYCSNDPANPDYIRSVDSCDFKLAPSFFALNSEIKEKVESRLKGQFDGYGCHRVEHMQQLIAPLLRYAFNLNRELDRNEEFKSYFNASTQDYFNVYAQAPENIKSMALKISDEVKRAMANNQGVARQCEGASTNDNSPGYGYYFNQEGMTFSGIILRLQISFNARQAIHAMIQNGARAESVDSGDICQRVSENLSGQDQICLDSGNGPLSLYCAVENNYGAHYSALIPHFMMERLSSYQWNANFDPDKFLPDELAYCAPCHNHSQDDSVGLNAPHNKSCGLSGLPNAGDGQPSRVGVMFKSQAGEHQVINSQAQVFSLGALILIGLAFFTSSSVALGLGSLLWLGFSLMQGFNDSKSLSLYQPGCSIGSSDLAQPEGVKTGNKNACSLENDSALKMKLVGGA